MLNYAVTHRGTDKKPCDNNMNALSSKIYEGALYSSGGEDMLKEFNMSTSFTGILDTVDCLGSKLAEIAPKIAISDEALGNIKIAPLPGNRHR